MSRSNDETIKAMFFSTEGRLNRLRYFKRTLSVNVISIIVSLILAVPFIDGFGNVSPSYDPLLTVIDLAVLIPEFFLDVRRLKDLNVDSVKEVAGWKAFVGALFSLLIDREFDFKAIILAVMFLGLALYLLFAPGTRGENKYGEDPLGGE